MSVVRLMAVALLAAACSAPVPPPEVRPSGTATPGVLDGVAVYPLGDVHGDVALVARGKPQWATGGPALGEIWAVPLDGSAPRLLVRYPGVYLEDRIGLTVLRRQLSADGRRLVLTPSLPTADPHQYSPPRLVLIDLVTTDAREVRPVPAPAYLTLRPALSPDGDLIAFDRYQSTFWIGVGTIRPDGSDVRDLCRAGMAIPDARGVGTFHGCGGVLGFAPDGRVAFAEVDGYSLVDASGAIERIGYRLSSMLAVDRRGSEPSLVATTSVGIVTSDAHGRSQRILVGPGAFPQEFEPRWRPGHDDVLVREGQPPSSKLVVLTPSGPVELATGRVERDGRCATRAEWSPDGSKVVYLSDCVTDPFVIRTIDVGGRMSPDAPDRALAQLPDGRDGWKPLDIVVVHYP